MPRTIFALRTPLCTPLRTIPAAIILIAARAYATASRSIIYYFFAALGLVTLLSACTTPQPPVTKAVYDFGPPAAAASPPLATATSANNTTTVAVALADVEAVPALDNPAVLYRLGYADAWQLRPYALARWSMAPARLLQQRLRETLSIDRAVVGSTDGATLWLLRVELEEFSQLFSAPNTSAGVVRLRATLLRAGNLVAQRSFNVSSNAPSADASGGVRGLATASNDVVRQVNAWLAEQVKTP